MRIVSHAHADQRGFTLAEFLVAIAIVGLIMAGVLTIIMTGNETYATGANQIEAQQAARVALERMVREIRGAGYNPKSAACPPNCPIVAAPGLANPTATALLIQNDNDGNGAFAGPTERIVYTLNGTNLQRQDLDVVGSQPETIVGGIQALTFTYLDENDAVIVVVPGNIQTIRSVQISLTTQPENQPAAWQIGKVLVTMSDKIRLRNR